MRSRNTLSHSQTLFLDRDVFEYSYVPEQLYHRDAQLKELAYLARPAIYGASAESAILRGLPGTGKTTTVRNLFAEIEGMTRKVVPVYINCEQHRTPSAVYGCIYSKLTGNIAPSTSRHLDDIIQSSINRLQERNAALLICLDDADYLHHAGRLNSLLYQLLRLYERWDVRKAGVLAVTSDLALNLRAVVDARVSSVFQPAEVFFHPYTNDEIREILSERIRQGLYPNVIAKECLDLIVSITAEKQDLRVGIKLIRSAATRAEDEGRRTVTQEDVMAASQADATPTLKTLAAGLLESERALLYLIAALSQEEDAEVTSNSVFESVQEYVPIGRTTYHSQLKRLRDTGIVSMRTRGKHRKITLLYAPEEVMAACERSDLPGQAAASPR